MKIIIKSLNKDKALSKYVLQANDVPSANMCGGEPIGNYIEIMLLTQIVP